LPGKAQAMEEPAVEEAVWSWAGKAKERRCSPLRGRSYLARASGARGRGGARTSPRREEPAVGEVFAIEGCSDLAWESAGEVAWKVETAVRRARRSDLAWESGGARGGGRSDLAWESGGARGGGRSDLAWESGGSRARVRTLLQRVEELPQEALGPCLGKRGRGRLESRNGCAPSPAFGPCLGKWSCPRPRAFGPCEVRG
jgi:hypothetical protein